MKHACSKQYFNALPLNANFHFAEDDCVNPILIRSIRALYTLYYTFSLFIFSYVIHTNSSSSDATVFFECDKGKVIVSFFLKDI